MAGILGAAVVLIAWAALPRGDSGREEEPQPLLDFRSVLADRDVLALMVGYAAAIWGCVGLRQWIVVFLTFCAGDQANVPAQAWIILVVGAVISFIGVPAGLIGNELAIRYGLRTIATLVFVLSAAAGGLFGFTAKLPHIAVLGLSVAAGFIVQGNFSNLTSGRARRCRSAVPRGNDRVLFLHRLCGWVPRDPPVRRHARPVRGDIAACRLDCELLHLRTRLPGRRLRHNFPAPEHLATVASLGRNSGIVIPGCNEQNPYGLIQTDRVCLI